MAMNKKGLALVGIIILITFLSIPVLSASIFTLQRLTAFDTQQRDLRCRYNAQAGVHYAVYQYRQNGTLATGQTNIDSDNYFVLNTTGGGGAAANLVINATAAYLALGNRNLQGVTIRNASATTAITIDRMIVGWSGPNNRNLQSIVINGSTVWTGSVSNPPVNVNITNFTLNPSTTYPITRFRWSNTVFGRTITLQCVMTDGSTTSTCTVFPAQPSECITPAGNLTIQSMGKTAGSGMYRTVQATYNTATGNISDYDEISAAVP